jgi:hypothetical protein
VELRKGRYGPYLKWDKENVKIPRGIDPEKLTTEEVAVIIERELPARVCGGWRAIESAPRDGTEINGYREDQGVFTFRWASMEEFGHPCDDREGWWHDRWGWMDGDLTPTRWQPLPQPPEGGAL